MKKIKVPVEFSVSEYLKSIDWKSLREELKLSPEQFWGLKWLRQRRAEKRAHFNSFHQARIAEGYKHREKKGEQRHIKELEGRLDEII